MGRIRVLLELDYDEEALVPGGIRRCDPTTEAELITELERHLNASSDACKGGVGLRKLPHELKDEYLVAEVVELAEELAALRVRGEADEENHHGLPGWSYWSRKGRWYKDAGDLELRVYRVEWEVVRRDQGVIGQGSHDYAPRATMRMLEGILATGGDFPSSKPEAAGGA